MSAVAEVITLHALSLGDLWAEAESLGNVKVHPKDTGWDDADPRKGYRVTITGRRKHTVLAVCREHESFACALSDAVQEAREMGLGQ